MDTFTTYPKEQLHEAFDKVCNPENWKLPIDATCTRADIDILSEAIVFFAGCRPTFEPIHGTDNYRVRAVGYYAAVGS